MAASRRSRALLVIALAGAAALAGPAGAETGRAKRPAAPPSETAIIAASGLPGRAVGYVVYDLKARRRLVAKAAKRLFVPASVAKVPTTVAALGMLGHDYRFETRVYARTTGAARNGVLAGDLVLVGGGDPLLTGDHMRAIVEALGRRGVRGIAGRFLYDETLLKRIEKIAEEQPDHAPHNTGLGALSVNFNRIQMTWVRAGKQAVLQTTTTSNTDKMKVEIETIRFALGRPGGRTRGPFSYAALGEGGHWIVSPYLRRRGRVWLPVRRAGRTAAAVFRKIGASHGLDLPRPRPGSLPKDARLLQTHRSKPLSEVVRRVLRYSNNTAAELTGLVATRATTRKPLDLAQSGATIAGWLKARMPAADWSGFVLKNHSGLTLDSRMSPDQVLAILRYAATRRYGRFTYAELLRAYHLRRKARPRARYRVRAKSGTMNYIRGRAGYITTVRGRALAFVLFIEEAGARRDADQSARTRRRSRFGPRGWMHRARKLEHDLIARWVKVY